jgi:hypothetical protein
MSYYHKKKCHSYKIGNFKALALPFEATVLTAIAGRDKTYFEWLKNVT